MRKWLKKSEEESCWAIVCARVRALLSLPPPSLHPIQGSRSPRHPADLNLATAPGTAQLPLPFGHASYALAACPLRAIRLS
ncbi:hypothetical protein ACFX13_024474 [Malus domestica]